MRVSKFIELLEKMSVSTIELSDCLIHKVNDKGKTVWILTDKRGKLTVHFNKISESNILGHVKLEWDNTFIGTLDVYAY